LPWERPEPNLFSSVRFCKFRPRKRSDKGQSSPRWCAGPISSEGRMKGTFNGVFRRLNVLLSVHAHPRRQTTLHQVPEPAGTDPR
jgi:hypothetical protein